MSTGKSFFDFGGGYGELLMQNVTKQESKMYHNDSLACKILEYIEQNRISSTEVADVLGKTGEIDSRLKPLIPRIRAAGKVYYAPSFNDSNWYTHFYLKDAPPCHIIYVEGVNCGRAIFGSLVAKYAILYKQSKGMVVSGKLRDAHTLIKERYPIWCHGVSPIGCYNTDNGINSEYYAARRDELDGAIMVADDSGVILINKHHITEDLLQGLIDIERQEDIWFDCIDRLKYSTFETVCLKKYEENL
jgi:regulator of RNase E activity RraA